MKTIVIGAILLLSYGVVAEAARVRGAKLALPSIKGIQNSLVAGDYALDAERVMNLENITHFRYQQKFRGLPIWGKRVLVNEGSGGVVEFAHGSYVDEIEKDISSTIPALNEASALELAQNEFLLEYGLTAAANLQFRIDNLSLQIFVQEDQKAKLVYIVQFFVQGDGLREPTRPLYIIDATSGAFVQKMETLSTSQLAMATGPGGNSKIGRYEYGRDFPSLPVILSEGNLFRMESENVRVVDCKNTTLNCSLDAYTFSGLRNEEKPVNGAFSPINDAAFFGNVTFNMYQAWYQLNPLKNQLILQVHYGLDFENAGWDGKKMLFGDGASSFFPLVSLDVIAHEVSHGFTEFNSGLVYRGESGGINEAFSDMAGEAAKYFAAGSNDFETGRAIVKGEKALRYMNDPVKDGLSVGHVKDYKPGMNVHFSSGIYNKAFYLLATSPGWNTRKAFDVFVRANQLYWEPQSTFVTAAQGVAKATTDLNFNLQDVKLAFGQVGIEI